LAALQPGAEIFKTFGPRQRIISTEQTTNTTACVQRQTRTVN